jgi:hypothetical protein
VTAADLCAWIYSQEADRIAEGVHIIYTHKAKGEKEPVEWSLLEDRRHSAFYVVFRGSVTAFDWITNMQAGSKDDTAHGLRVHSGMAGALHRHTYKVVDEVQEMLARTNKPENNAKVLLCGHSLGGAYAQLVALELLQKQKQSSRPNKVFTFGSPQVIIPPDEHSTDQAHAIWATMNQVSTASFIDVLLYTHVVFWSPLSMLA